MGITIKHNKSLKALPSKVRTARRVTQCKALDITSVLPSGAWKGKTCLIFGGGPSLKGFDFSAVKGFPTIGVNKSFITYPTNILYAMDVCFYDMLTSEEPQHKELHQQWLAYKGIKLFFKHSTKTGFDKSVYVVNNLKRKAVSFNLTRGIYGGNNSGFGALMLAVGLGAIRIGLLGYSMKVQKEHNKIITHWHGGYARGRPSTFQSKLDKFRKCFEEFAPTIAQQGIEVVNLVEKSEDSKLDCFPKESITTFLK
jgi:hypothetical protein